MTNYAVNTDSANFELGLFAVERALETFVGELARLAGHEFTEVSTGQHEQLIVLGAFVHPGDSPGGVQRVNLIRRAIGHTSHKGLVLESFGLNPAKVRDVPSDDHRTGPFAISEGLGNQQYRLLAICTCQHLDLNPVAAFHCAVNYA